MNKGRSCYNFNLKCDMNLANQLMQSYINSNRFKKIEKKGETYYQSNIRIFKLCFIWR